MTYDDMKATLKDIAEILKAKGDAGADAVWVWLDLAGAKGETCDEIAAIEARLAPQGIELLNRYGHLVKPKPWVGVDFDCTLAEYEGDWTKLGDPIPRVMSLVRDLLFNEIEVRIFTARAAIPEQVKAIQDWCEANQLPRLRVTATKDFNMVCLVDDRAIHVAPNDGTFHVSPKFRSLHPKIARFL